MSNDRYELSGGNPSPIDRSVTKLLYVSTANTLRLAQPPAHHAFTELFYVVWRDGTVQLRPQLPSPPTIWLRQTQCGAIELISMPAV